MKYLMLVLLLMVTGNVYGQEDEDDGQSIDTIIRNSMPTAHAGDFIQMSDDGQHIIVNEDGRPVVKVEMDMLYSEDDYELLQQHKLAWNETEDVDCAEENRRMKRKATNYRSKRWTNNVIPYWINTGHFGSAARSQIDQSINEWNSKTCLNLRPWRSGDRNYIKLQNGGGCSSYVGMQGGGQPVSLASGCRIKRIIVHEIGHAVGFQHEQTRPDRNSYVTIYLQNIYNGMAFNFDHYDNTIVNTYRVPYDYGSVMHYGGTAFSKNGQYTIRTHDPKWQRAIGNAPGLSFSDIKLANLMYNCGGNCGNKKCPGTGYLDKNCKCQCNTGSAYNPISECTGDDGDDGDDDDDDDDDDNGGKECVDNNRQCSSWASQGECNKNPGYMKVNCKKSCKVCTDGGGGGGANCKDISSRCSGWAANGECTRSAGYMNTYCKKSCNKCTGGGGTTCKDKNNYCKSWAQSKFCSKPLYKSYMKNNCKKSCGYCGSTSSEGCIDADANCPAWASSGECTKNPAYMLVSCKKSCNVCSSGVSNSDACFNSQGDTYCAMYASICQTNASMKTYCAKTCGFC